MAQSASSLRLLFVGQLPPHPGGSAISVGQLLAGFASRGCQIEAVAPITAAALELGDSFAERNPALRLSRYEVPYFDVITYEAAPDEFRRQERARLAELVPPLIARLRPDLVICGRETFSWYVPELARAHSLPCVLFARGNPTNAILRGAYPAGPAAYFLEQYRKADLIVTAAQHMADGLRARGFERVLTIPTAVDTRRFSPGPRPAEFARELQIEPDDIVVALVANLHRRKRPFDLIASAELALAREPRLRYVVAGDGVLRSELQAEVRRRGLDDRFRFLGWVDYDRIPDVLRLADIAVLPSEAEGLARAYLEAQASGRVLVASDIPPAREVIQDGQTGLLFRLGDPVELAERTLEAARRPALRAEIGGRARIQAERSHSIDDAVGCYLANLERVVRARQAEPPTAV